MTGWEAGLRIEGVKTPTSRPEPPMTSTKSAEAISPLRRRMLEDMTVRKFSDKTRYDYIRCIESFAKFLGRSPDTATPDDLRRYQVHQTESGIHPPAMNSSTSALRFFFKITLGRADLATQLARIHYPRRLPRVLIRRSRAVSARHPPRFGGTSAPR